MKINNPNEDPRIRKAIIEKETGGVIGTHKFEGGELENSFMTKDGKYIGDLSRANWYLDERLKVYDKYPHGVAVKMNKNNQIEGYYGYTHRGGQKFKIGDRLFDENYKPKKKDYSEKEWNEFKESYNKGLKKAIETKDKSWEKDIRKSGISMYIPFRLRGSKIIENLEEATQAAINISKYLS